MLKITKEWLTPKETAKLIGLTVSWLQKNRSNATGIPYNKNGNSQSSPIRYRLNDILAYLDSKKIQTM